MIDFLDLHTHRTATPAGITSIQSLSLTSDIFLAMPKKKPIAIGLHPWEATLAALEMQMKYLRVLARQDNVKLIGECGLDKLKGEPLNNQLLILTEQIALAEDLKKPLIIHCVKAYAELIELKEKLKVKVPMVIHGFNKKEELGKQLMGKGFYLSFGASILKGDTDTAKLIKETTTFFLETDDATVSIVDLYQAVAELKNCSVEELKQLMFSNWQKLNLI